MFLQELYLYQFRNIKEAEINFSPLLNFFFGENGVGKTNILDAIHYLSLTKSFINSTDTDNILYNADFFRIYGKYINDETIEEFSCIVNKEGRKHFKHFSKNYSRLSDHIGKVPIVVISPFDQFIITEGSDFRRKLMDLTISQYDKIYLINLSDYNRVLKQRNALLKLEQPEHVKMEMLEIMNMQIEKPANYIFKARKTFIENIQNTFNHFYNLIAQKNNEKINLQYRSFLSENDFMVLLRENVQKDITAETTTIGVHKDDILFFLGDKPIRYFASQGQQKTFLTALKLSILDYMSHFNAKPILLLDDIFDKLDYNRVRNLVNTVLNEGIQVFVTHTNMEQFMQLNLANTSEIQIFEVINGKINQYEQ